jgi:magnesium-transporting ATPase (P-type)
MDEAPREADGDEVDDAFRAVLEGLRTTLPGVQVLFAFLLTLPFLESFDDLLGSEKTAFYLAFFGSAVASILLIAPSAHQRLRAPISGVKRRSARHLQITVRITIVGTIVFAVALAAAVYLVSSLVMKSGIDAVLATVAVTALLGWSWFYVALVTFADHKR